MKFFEVWENSAIEFPFNLELTKGLIVESRNYDGGLELKLSNKNLIQGMDTVSFLIYIIKYDLMADIPVGKAIVEIADNNVTDTLEYQVRFSEKEFKVCKKFT